MFYKVVNVSDFSASEIDDAYFKLSVSQRNHIDRKSGLKFKQSVVSRIIINDLLYEHFNVNDGFNLSLDSKGLPLYNNNEYYVSISHSGDLVACVVSDKKVGIDIEVYKEIPDRLINKVCTTEEIEYINSNENNGFFHIWTAKEAFSKYSGMFLYNIFKMSFVEGGNIISDKYSAKIFQYNTSNYSLTVIE